MLRRDRETTCRDATVFANWGGKHVFIGDYFYSNFNLTLVDDGKSKSATT